MTPFGRTSTTLILVAAGLVGPVVLGGDGDYPSIKFSGFLSAVGGKVLAGTPQGDSAAFEEGLPLYIADWANWGIYTKSASLSPESRFGVQAVAKFTEDLSFTGQVTVRGTEHTPQLQWAYLGYKFTPDLEIQVGRKRIPLYYYSDFQDIGLAYPWISPPAELYGWEATNYNGANLRYKTSLQGIPVALGLFGGKETVKDDRYMRSAGQFRTDVSWDKIIGGDVEITRNWLTVRGVYMQTDLTFTDKVDSGNSYQSKMKAYSLALNADFDQWFVLSEIAQNARNYDGYYFHAPVFSVGVGARFGKWTPFLNYGQYRETCNDPAYAPINWKRPSLTLRYDPTPSTAIKLQVDRYLEYNGTAYTADSTVLRISFDWVF